MSWFRKLFGQTGSDSATPSSASLPRLLAIQRGGVELAPVFDRESVSELEAMCRQMPIEALELTPGISKEMDWAVQVTFTLAQYVACNKDLSRYADLVVPRLISRLKQHDPKSIIVALCPEIRDLGLSLIKGGRNREALDCLRYAQKTAVGDAYGGGPFWIFAATINIAYSSESREEIQAALDLVHTLSPDEREQMDGLIRACHQALKLGGKPRDHVARQ